MNISGISSKSAVSLCCPFSRKNFDYLDLLEETDCITRADKAGATAMDLPPIFKRLELGVGY